MPYQIFSIYRAPEEPPLDAKELQDWIWKCRIGSEWHVKELDKPQSDKVEEQ